MNKVPNSTATSAAASPDPLDCTVLTDPTPPDPRLLPPQSAADTSEAAAARAAMVARLEEGGDLGPGPVREALLALPRQILMPQAYVRRSGPEEMPPCWDLLDFACPVDRAELMERLHSGDSVAIQHDGEPILGRVPGPRRGGVMTAMSSTMSLTAGLQQQLDLRPGQRVLDVGTGAGVTASVACFVCGDAGVVTLDIDPHVTAAARERLSALGYRPTTLTSQRAASPSGALTWQLSPGETGDTR
ncbi:50S ribosomal protein L11 methyltransferase [Streptomyces sp. NPDC091027]|uniref:50S ribosomal protein L11 methyltransferase n=1 Tax=Streptomyces sp. NPDC091027 TaxID=3365971 RepID=UPI0037F1458F